VVRPCYYVPSKHGLRDFKLPRDRRILEVPWLPVLVTALRRILTPSPEDAIRVLKVPNPPHVFLIQPDWSYYQPNSLKTLSPPFQYEDSHLPSISDPISDRAYYSKNEIEYMKDNESEPWPVILQALALRRSRALQLSPSGISNF